MIELAVEIDDSDIRQIIYKHINDKVRDLINWYSMMYDPTKFLPDWFSAEECDMIINKLIQYIESPKIVKLSDQKMQFALSCFLEEEEKIIVPEKELSAVFSSKDRKHLEKFLPDEIIRYYESYDNYRNMLLPDNAYLDIVCS